MPSGCEMRNCEKAKFISGYGETKDPTIKAQERDKPNYDATVAWLDKIP
jgi:hypothetical protein